MSFLGNILWFIFGGLFSGLSWVLSGIIWCITIIGIPYGKQCFKFASMSFAPFGKEIEYGDQLLNVNSFFKKNKKIFEMIFGMTKRL